MTDRRFGYDPDDLLPDREPPESPEAELRRHYEEALDLYREMTVGEGWVLRLPEVEPWN